MNPYSDLEIFDDQNTNSGAHSTYALNCAHIVYNKECNQSAFSVCVRSDVTSDSILDFVEQILLTLGGGLVVRAKDSINELEYMEIKVAGPASDVICWNAIRVYLGNSSTKDRVIFAIITAKGSLKSYVIPEKINNLSSIDELLNEMQHNVSNFYDFRNILADYVYLSLFQEFFTAYFSGIYRYDNNVVTVEEPGQIRDIQNFRDIRMYAVDYINSGLIPKFHRYGESPPLMLKSFLDVNYVRDLQYSFTLDMRDALAVPGDAFDKKVAVLERSCARLMTCLKGMFTRSNVGMPDPPERQSTNQFKLYLPKIVNSVSKLPEVASGCSISESSLETSSLLIFKARKHSMKVSEKFEHLIASTSKEVYYQYFDCNGRKIIIQSLTAHLREVTQAVCVQLQLWVKEEAIARLVRRAIVVARRYCDLNNYLYSLLWKLHNRMGSLLGAHMVSPADREGLAQLRTNFHFLSEEEPLLFDTPVSVRGRNGVLSITAGHLLFQSSYAFMSEDVQIVLPWERVADVKLSLPDSKKKSDIVNSNESSIYNVASGLKSFVISSAQTISGSDSTLLINTTDGESLQMVINNAIPDFSSRVHDLLRLLFEDKFYAKLFSGKYEVNSSYLPTSPVYMSAQKTILTEAIASLGDFVVVESGVRAGARGEGGFSKSKSDIRSCKSSIISALLAYFQPLVELNGVLNCENIQSNGNVRNVDHGLEMEDSEEIATILKDESPIPIVAIEITNITSDVIDFSDIDVPTLAESSSHEVISSIEVVQREPLLDLAMDSENVVENSNSSQSVEVKVASASSNQLRNNIQAFLQKSRNPNGN